MIIAIQPDRIRSHDGGIQSYSDRWKHGLNERGYAVRNVDVYRSDILGQLEGADAFMWRFSLRPDECIVRRRLLPVLEMQLGLQIYPDWNTWWHYDDKIAQKYLLEAAGLPVPRTWLFWRECEAIQFCREAAYPLVMKLSVGASSQNVRMLRSRTEAEKQIKRMFSSGLISFDRPKEITHKTLLGGLRKAVKSRIVKSAQQKWMRPAAEKNYLLVQEFLTGNTFDTRVVIIGRRGFAFRRFNRHGDWRASGSGLIDDNPDAIDQRFVRLGFATSRILQMNSLAVDGLCRGDGTPVIVEISYTCPTWTVANCPGHWILNGEPEEGALEWQAGRVWPQDAILGDFLTRIEGGTV